MIPTIPQNKSELKEYLLGIKDFKDLETKAEETITYIKSVISHYLKEKPERREYYEEELEYIEICYQRQDFKSMKNSIANLCSSIEFD